MESSEKTPENYYLRKTVPIIETSEATPNSKPSLQIPPNQSKLNINGNALNIETTNYASSSAPQAHEKIRTRLFSGNQAGTGSSRIPKVTSLTDFLYIELTRGYRVELEEERFTARRDKVYTFICIPKELERFMSYGFFQCLDAFLYLFTFLPIRCVLAILSYSESLVTQFLNFTKTVSSSVKRQSNEKCDLLKLLILATCIYILSFIDTSVMYHVIKSQSVIKLYIFFNMLEVGDRLFASFVQDTLDALFLTAVEKVPEDRRSYHRISLLAHLCLTIFSVAGHAVVLLLQGTTLNVAINSSNRALLTVMMSNNFVELKGAVFKKFDKLNLFQVSCSDVRERFHLCVLLFIVCIQTMREYQWEESRFWILLYDCMMVMLAEIGVDWIKHAFVTRFNEISPEVYREYTLSLAFDLAQTKNRRAFSDSSDMIGRRLGFVPLPLAVVLVKVMRPSLKSLDIGNCILLVLVYVAVTTFRLLNSVVLLGKACTLIDEHHGKKAEVVQEDEEELVERHRHESAAKTSRSHPTTRTPSPSRGIIVDSDSNNGSPIKVGVSFSASQSMCGTPRTSVVVGNIIDDTSHLLFANSAVSMLSMNLNEELLKSTVNSPTEKSKVHLRKYSLGNEFKFDTVEEIDSTLNPSTPTPDNDSEVENVFTPSQIEGAGSLEVEKSQEDGDRSVETSTTVKKRKGLSWLLHH